MVSRRTRVASWIFRRDHPSRPRAMICCFFSSFKTFAMLREVTYPPAAVNVLDVSSESMAAFQVFMEPRRLDNRFSEQLSHGSGEFLGDIVLQRVRGQVS